MFAQASGSRGPADITSTKTDQTSLLLLLTCEWPSASPGQDGCRRTWFDGSHVSAAKSCSLCWLPALCASSSAKLGGHECWSCGLTECEFLVFS